MTKRASLTPRDRALTLILTCIVPGVGRADLEREVADIIAGRER